MRGENKSNEVRVSGESLYSNKQKIGNVFGNENCRSDGTYIVNGTEVYQNHKKVGYACDDGTVRMNDGTVWKYF